MTIFISPKKFLLRRDGSVVLCWTHAKTLTNNWLKAKSKISNDFN
jgi:hypothetical protein